ncbi:MAG: plasmid stabilization system protein ParE [Planctomycetota bacterium]
MTGIELSVAARTDRREITEHTVERFGIAQARRLRDTFEAALSRLAESPNLGRASAELDPPNHSFRYYPVMKSFIIVYEPTDDGIRVARLLHGARNLAIELDRDSGED